MTRNHPALRKAASNADLYSDPSPPRPLRHSYSTLSRAHTTAAMSHRSRQSRAADSVWQNTESLSGNRSRHSIAASYPNLLDVDEDYYPAPSRSQNPPPVPPKIPEVPLPHASLEASHRTPSHPWLPAALPPAPLHSKEDPEKYTKPFTDFMTANPTIFHAVDAVAKDLEKDGYKKLSERDTWELKAGGKYYVDRNGTSLIAFAVGSTLR